MGVEPSGAGGLKLADITSDDNAGREEKTPGQSIENSMQRFSPRRQLRGEGGGGGDNINGGTGGKVR